MDNQKNEPYDVFLSYSRKDEAIAEKLSRRIRQYKPPRATGLGKQRLKVFRDNERLTASSDLSDELNERLHASNKLLLLCSPDSGNSKWVNLEVQEFLKIKSFDSLLFVLCRGELTDGFPPVLNNFKKQPLYIDIREANRKKFRIESLRLIAALYNVDFMMLLREDEYRRRRRIRQAILGLTAFLFFLFSGYLITITEPVYWQKITQPEASDHIRRTNLLPVHEVAISQQEPSKVLFLGRNATWFGEPPFHHLTPTADPKGFDSIVIVNLLKTGTIIKAAKIEFEINEFEAQRGKGEMHINAVVDDRNQVRYIRSFTYSGINDEGENLLITSPPLLLAEGESPFDLGRPSEMLEDQGLINGECDVQGKISNLINGDIIETSYNLDINFLDGYSSREEIWGEEYWILPNWEESELSILGERFEKVKHARSFWDRIVSSSEWATFQAPELCSIYYISFSREAEDAEEAAQRISNSIAEKNINVQGLKKLLLELNIWYEDYVNVRLLSTKSAFGYIHAIQLQCERHIPHDAPEVNETIWVLKFSSSTDWKCIKLPSDQIEGIWSINASGTNSLLLSSDLGYQQTVDGGNSWSSANFNENGFSQGNRVKTIVLNKTAIFALIDRGHSNTDSNNPLYRLQKRSLLDRWRAGLIKILQ